MKNLTKWFKNLFLITNCIHVELSTHEEIKKKRYLYAGSGHWV